MFLRAEFAAKPIMKNRKRFFQAIRCFIYLQIARTREEYPGR